MRELVVSADSPGKKVTNLGASARRWNFALGCEGTRKTSGEDAGQDGGHGQGRARKRVRVEVVAPAARRETVRPRKGRRRD